MKTRRVFYGVGSKMFVPHAINHRHQLNAAPILTETLFVRDLTMPERDWSVYDSLAKDRFISKRKKPDLAATPDNVTPIMPAMLRRQAQ
jgi:hypothetical protein